MSLLPLSNPAAAPPTTPAGSHVLLWRAVEVLGLGVLLALAGCGGEPAGEEAPSTEGPEPEAPASTVGLAGVVRDGLELADVVVTEPVMGERSALYLTVRDTDGGGDALLGLEVEGVGMASLHRTGPAEGGEGMGMRPVDSLVVAPDGELRLRPGGAHGMLEELEAAWAPADTVGVRLRFRRAGAVQVRARVVPYAELDAIFPSG